MFRNGKECILLKTKTNENQNTGVISGKKEDTCPNKSESGKLISFPEIEVRVYIIKE